MKVTNYEEGRQTPKGLIGLRHVGLSAQNPAALADFYHVVLGLNIVPTDTAALGPTAFLSGHPESIVQAL